MMPSAAITAVCGIGNARSAQMRAMPRAHAQLSYFCSVSTASLASRGIGIVAQEASTSDRMPITIRPDLTWASERVGPALLSDRYSQRRTRALQSRWASPNRRSRFAFLARDDAVADR